MNGCRTLDLMAHVEPIAHEEVQAGVTHVNAEVNEEVSEVRRDPETERRLIDEAVALAQRWTVESAEVEADPAAERLAGVLKDPNGLPFTIGFVDGVMRPESLSAAASHLHRVAPLVPDFLPWYLRGAVRVGGAMAPVLPAPVVPIA